MDTMDVAASIDLASVTHYKRRRTSAKQPDRRKVKSRNGNDSNQEISQPNARTVVDQLAVLQHVQENQRSTKE